MLEYTDIETYLRELGAEGQQVDDTALVRFSLNGTAIAYASVSARPARISLRCDEVLGASLIEKYESVMPGQNLDPKKWITIVLSGQLSDQEVYDLITHASHFA